MPLVNPTPNTLIPVEGADLDVYLDQVGGDDNNTGLSPGNRIQTIDRLWDVLYGYRYTTKDAQQEYKIRVNFANGTYPGNLNSVKFPMPQALIVTLRSDSGDATLCTIENLSISGDETNEVRIQDIRLGNPGDSGLTGEGALFALINCEIEKVTFRNGANMNLINAVLNSSSTNAPILIENYVSGQIDEVNKVDSTTYAHFVDVSKNSFLEKSGTDTGNPFTGITAYRVRRNSIVEEAVSLPGANPPEVDVTSFYNDAPGYQTFAGDAAAGVGGLTTGQLFIDSLNANTVTAKS